MANIAAIKHEKLKLETLVRSVGANRQAMIHISIAYGLK